MLPYARREMRRLLSASGLRNLDLLSCWIRPPISYRAASVSVNLRCVLTALGLLRQVHILVTCSSRSLQKNTRVPIKRITDLCLLGFQKLGQSFVLIGYGQHARHGGNLGSAETPPRICTGAGHCF